jgi:hypothetical protein
VVIRLEEWCNEMLKRPFYYGFSVFLDDLLGFCEPHIVNALGLVLVR